MSKPFKVSDYIKELNEKLKKQEKDESKSHIKENITKCEIKKKQNVEEMLKDYKNNNTYKTKEEEEIIKNLENTYYYYKEKQKKIEKELEDPKKLYSFRWKKNKEMLQIYKIFEMEKKVLQNIKIYNDNKSPNDKEKKEYLQKLESAKKIIEFQQKEEIKQFKRKQELDNIKIFNEEIIGEDNYDKNNEDTLINNNTNTKNNTILKTINDDFKNSKDCHLIKNNLINFIPQIEINFSDEIPLTKELISQFKKELKEIFEDENFSIIEINKGSTHFLISLQFIFKKISENSKKGIKNLLKNVKSKVKDYATKIKNNNFCIFGKNKEKAPDTVKEFVKDIKDSEQEIIQIFQEKVKGESINENTNFYELSKSFTMNDLNEVIESLQLEDIEKQEYNQLLKNYGEYYDIFGESFEKALAYTIFEYQLINIYTVDRDDYEEFKKNKEKCLNAKEQLLFHGTKNEYLVSILKTCIDINKNNAYKLGKGFYLSDLFEVSWRYGGGWSKIPKVGDSFSVLVCNTYYSKDLFENCQKEIWKEELIAKNAVRFSKVGADFSVIPPEELKNYDKFIQNEFLISYKEQMIPIYGIILRRVEYLIIWRDNNFDRTNPNNYEDYEIMLKFNQEMQDFAYKEINTKIYYVNSTEEGLKLIDRKKYNKIIIITNGGNNGEEYIKEARKIIGGNTLALVSCYMPDNHIKWVSELPNTLLSNEKEIFQEFLLNAVQEKKNEMKNLRIKVEEKYGKKFEKFNENEIFNFPNFLPEGEYSQLRFIPKYNQ
jgi:hypothetical protein